MIGCGDMITSIQLKSTIWILPSIMVLGLICIIFWINIYDRSNLIGPETIFSERFTFQGNFSNEHQQYVISRTTDIPEVYGEQNKNDSDPLVNKTYSLSSGASTLYVDTANLTGNNLTSTEKHYMTASSMGRLGNQMFQYAALFATSRNNPAWIPLMRDGNYFSLLRTTFGRSLSINVANVSNVTFNRVGADVDADLTIQTLRHLPKTDVILSGFFQSYKYFSGTKNDIRNEFTFPSRVQDEVQEYYKNITPFEWKREQFVRVGIHVRRTNLISENRQKMGFIPRPPSYFVHAMNYFMKLHNRVQFIVASDDLSWCKKNIIGDHVVYSTHNYIIDLAILSLSDHVIISIGTYSWWAGWLCQGTTVYYGKLPPNDTYLGKVYNNNSCVPVPDDTYNNWVAVV